MNTPSNRTLGEWLVDRIPDSRQTTTLVVLDDATHPLSVFNFMMAALVRRQNKQPHGQPQRSLDQERISLEFKNPKFNIHGLFGYVKRYFLARGHTLTQVDVHDTADSGTLYMETPEGETLAVAVTKEDDCLLDIRLSKITKAQPDWA